MAKGSGGTKKREGKRTRQTEKAFSDTTCATIVKWLGYGFFRESAAIRAGVCERTLRNWMEQGRKDLEAAQENLAPGEIPNTLALTDHAKFLIAVEKAEAEAEAGMVTRLVGEDARGEDIRWFLERRYPKRYGKMAMRVELSGPDGGPMEVVDARQILLGRLSAVVASGSAEEGDPRAEPG